jgi:hypothetical protein
VSGDDVERLYRMLAELRDEVHGYRKDLNGRLRALEAAEAARGGAEGQRENTTRIVFGVAGMAAAVSAVMAFVLDRL